VIFQKFYGKHLKIKEFRVIFDACFLSARLRDSTGSGGCIEAGTRYCRAGPMKRRTLPFATATGVAILPFAAERFRAARDQGFRDFHAAKGSNRA
jgi:hypothetical protein